MESILSDIDIMVARLLQKDKNSKKFLLKMSKQRICSSSFWSKLCPLKIALFSDFSPLDPLFDFTSFFAVLDFFKFSGPLCFLRFVFETVPCPLFKKKTLQKNSGENIYS